MTVHTLRWTLRSLSAVCLVVLTLSAGTVHAVSSPEVPAREAAVNPSQPPVLLQPPKDAAPATRIETEKPEVPLPSGGTRIMVRGFRIDGDSPLPAVTLQALLQGEAGK